MPVTMILSAGLGTRLSPLTELLPKPLLPVGDKSMLERVITRSDGTRREPLVMNAHHLADRLVEFVRNSNLQAKVSVESELLGTAGGIRRARSWLGSGPVLIHNGDILTNLDERPLLRRARTEALVLLVARRDKGQGTVGVDGEGRVVRLRGECFGEEVAGAEYVGIAALGPHALDTLPERGCLIGDWALAALRRGHSIATELHASPWWDIGRIPSYHQANLAWLRDLVDAAQATESYLGRDARVASGVELRESLVLAGALVEGHGVLERVVVWPLARAVAPLSNAIVLPDHRVVRVRNS